MIMLICILFLAPHLNAASPDHKAAQKSKLLDPPNFNVFSILKRHQTGRLSSTEVRRYTTAFSWGTKKLKPTRQLHDNGPAVASVCGMRNGDIAWGCEDGTIHIYRLAIGKVICTLNHDPDDDNQSVRGLYETSDDRLVSVSDNLIKVWNYKSSQQPQKTIKVNNDYINSESHFLAPNIVVMNTHREINKRPYVAECVSLIDIEDKTQKHFQTTSDFMLAFALTTEGKIVTYTTQGLLSRANGILEVRDIKQKPCKRTSHSLKNCKVLGNITALDNGNVLLCGKNLQGDPYVEQWNPRTNDILAEYRLTFKPTEVFVRPPYVFFFSEATDDDEIGTTGARLALGTLDGKVLGYQSLNPDTLVCTILPDGRIIGANEAGQVWLYEFFDPKGDTI